MEVWRGRWWWPLGLIDGWEKERENEWKSRPSASLLYRINETHLHFSSAHKWPNTSRRVLEKNQVFFLRWFVLKHKLLLLSLPLTPHLHISSFKVFGLKRISYFCVKRPSLSPTQMGSEHLTQRWCFSHHIMCGDGGAHCCCFNYIVE